MSRDLLPHIYIYLFRKPIQQLDYVEISNQNCGTKKLLTGVKQFMLENVPKNLSKCSTRKQRPYIASKISICDTCFNYIKSREKYAINGQDGFAILILISILSRKRRLWYFQFLFIKSAICGSFHAKNNNNW